MPAPATPNSFTDNASWQRPSIRIRRLPSSNAIPRARAATINAGGRHRLGENGDDNGIQPPNVTSNQEAGYSSRDFGGYFTAQAPESSATRPRSGSGGHWSSRFDDQGATRDGGRRRSSSDPTRRHWEQIHGPHDPALRGAQSRSHMPALQEGDAVVDSTQRPVDSTLPVGPADAGLDGTGRNLGVARRLSNAWQASSRFLPTSNAANTRRNAVDDQYESDIVNVLDTIDPEISTLNTLTNVQNSLFVPSLGRYINRTPTYTLTRHASKNTVPGAINEDPDIEQAAESIPDDMVKLKRQSTANSLTSRMDDDHFAVLPHGERLEGWTAEDRAELNDHVRHLLHSRREGIKRGLKGFGQYVRKPLGFFVTIYATLITLFGTAWVLFLIGWINLGGRRDYIINVVDNVLVALFAIMGDGLAPFRAVDTYHMCFIAHYTHLTWRLRKEQSLPKLQNHNDLPGLGPSDEEENPIEMKEPENGQTERSVLNEDQQKRLEHHQKKFARSHTFYKPHETTTHFAFPLRILVAVVVLLDCHSLLQISLGACTWGIPYETRPFALTTVILCCSLTCNITAGILISIGDHRTRKKDVLERMFRQELTAQAIEKIEKRHQKESERNGTLEVPGAGPSSSKELDKELSKELSKDEEKILASESNVPSKVS